MTARVHPLLVQTSVGPIGAVLTEPDASRRASMLLLHGEGFRFGPNRVWSQLAEELAARGIAVVRLDYPGRADSGAVRDGWKERLTAIREVAEWLRSETGGAPQLFFGSCAGARLVAELGAQRPAPAAIGMVTPYIRRIRSRHRLIRGLRRVVLDRVAVLRRSRGELDRRVPGILTTAARAAPVWILVGEGDFSGNDMARIGTSLNGLRIDVEVVPGVALQNQATLGAQTEVTRRVLAWADGRLRQG